MNQRRSRILEVLAIVVSVSIAAAVLLPSFHPGGHGGKVTSCSTNLRQLYQLGAIYASIHHGRWPEGTGGALWLQFTKSEPPLIGYDELEVLLCPVRGEPQLGKCDYLGPRKPVSELRPRDALAGDRPGNHGDSGSGNVLLKDGSVRQYDASDPIWQTLSD